MTVAKKEEKMMGKILNNNYIAVPLKALMINLLILKEVKCNADACPVSRQTMDIVSNCPTSESEWRTASQRKNCSAFASQCSDPDKFVYHCVINPFVNQTLEVCAYGKYIVLGYCAEYSYSGNIIQQNYDTDCSKFTNSRPCPSGYHSTEAFKYPGCYQLTKKSTVQNPTTAPSVHTSDTNMLVSTQNTSIIEEPGMEHVNDDWGYVIGVIIAAILVILIGIAVVIFVLRRHRPRSKEHLHEKETGGKNTQPVDGNEHSAERKQLLPSGKPVESEIARKTIQSVEDGEHPGGRLSQVDEQPNDC
ncbi:uncharacterized protein LOC133200433 isoform X2 [Saccostrea echinata]|uniref:uncharacterized protein LOC133200433 isoform X2 n=1 Tax=Saccostrea echinata TaxID=191078 RepID=UPI002A8254F4|nr:uncharacterized protein LOC133200433 isoform X2 [Saccostrea echinata]